jgi:hypothetical protein
MLGGTTKRSFHDQSAYSHGGAMLNKDEGKLRKRWFWDAFFDRVLRFSTSLAVNCSL